MKNVFLSLLARGPAHGYELKQAVDAMFGGVWPPINVGQVYTTLGRLERDGLVSSRLVAQEDRPDKRVYEITPAGRKALQTWVASRDEVPPVKDEFFMKLVLAARAGVAEPKELIARHRQAYLQALHDLNVLRLRLPPDGDPVPELLVEGTILHIQADLKWLDLCEERLASNS